MVRRSNRRYCAAPPQGVVEVLPASALEPPPSHDCPPLTPPTPSTSSSNPLANEPLLPQPSPSHTSSYCPPSPRAPPTPEFLDLSVSVLLSQETPPLSDSASSSSMSEPHDELSLGACQIESDTDLEDEPSPLIIDEPVSVSPLPPSPPAESRKQLAEGFYYVERIVDHALDEPTGQMMFLVNWHGYDNELDFTWEYEDNLRLCYGKVKSYCDQQSPKVKTKLVSRGGSSKSEASKGNYENWVTLDLVSTRLAQYLKLKSYATDAQIVSFDAADSTLMITSRNKSVLYVVLLNSHFYAVMYDCRLNTGYVGDSANEALKIGEDFEDLKSIMRCPLIPLEFVGSIGIDQCGAGVVSISLELLRLYKQDELVSHRELFVAPKLLKEVTARMHKQTSCPNNSWAPISARKKPSCRFCSYSNWNKKSVLTHEQRKH